MFIPKHDIKTKFNIQLYFTSAFDYLKGTHIGFIIPTVYFSLVACIRLNWSFYLYVLIITVFFNN